MFISAVNLSYLTVNSLTKLPGKITFIYMVQGSACVLGMICSNLVLYVMRDYNAYRVSMGLIMTSNILQNLIPNPKENVNLVYSLIFVQVFSIGVCLNLNYMIIATRLNP